MNYPIAISIITLERLGFTMKSDESTTTLIFKHHNHELTIKKTAEGWIYNTGRKTILINDIKDLLTELIEPVAS